MLPSGVFAVTYAQDQALIRTGKQWGALALFFVFLLAAPYILSPRLLAIGNIMLVTAIVVVGVQITMGYGGQVNLGQSAFMGVGAYAAGVASSNLGLPFWIAIPVGGASAATFGFIFGMSAVRIKGFYLALTTIAAQFIFSFAVFNLPASWLGASNGISLEPARLGGIVFNTDTSIYYLFLVSCTIMTTGAFGMMRSHIGRSFIAVRDDDIAAGMTGINVVWTKALAFLIGAFYAGIGGGLWEAFDREYFLPNTSVYNETCGAMAQTARHDAIRMDCVNIRGSSPNHPHPGTPNRNHKRATGLDSSPYDTETRPDASMWSRITADSPRPTWKQPRETRLRTRPASGRPRL